MDRFSQLVSLEPQGDFPHTLNNSVLVPLLLKSVSSVTEVGMSWRSRTFVAWMARAANLILPKVCTPICVAGPRAPLRSNLDDPEEWEISCSDGESVPVACRPIIKCGTTGCTRSCPTSVVGQTRAGFVGRPIGFLGMFCFVGGHIGPLEPREPGLLSFNYDKASSSVPVSAVGGTSEPAVISSFSAEVTAPSPCPLRNVTSTPESSGESHGTVTVTRTAQRMSSAHLVPVVPSGVELVSRATYISRKKRVRETCRRQSKAGRGTHRYHEDHIAAKGINSLSHFNLVRNSIPRPQAKKILAAKAAVEK